VPAIVRDGIDEPGQQGRPQRVELRRQGFAMATVLGAGLERRGGLLLDEPERDRLREPGACQDAATVRSRPIRASGAGAGW
jgi:hypothetical protein